MRERIAGNRALGAPSATHKDVCEEPAPYGRRWWALGVLCLVMIVAGMDALILNVAFPTLVRELDASSSQLQWIVDSYILVFAGLLLSMGSLGDRFGRKLAMNAGLLVFILGSVGAAFAGSSGVLIGMRALMGLGAALILPSTLSIITNMFHEKERGRAIGIWAGVAAGGILIGPTVGGALLEHFWWGSVFLVNVPIVAVTLLASWLLVPESRDPDATPLDPVGAVLSVGGLVSLVYGIIEEPSNGWTDAVTLASFAVGGVLLIGFVLWELRSPHPMLNMSFFRNPRFSAASVSVTLLFFGMQGVFFLLQQHLQFVMGYTPLQAGVRILPFMTMIVAAPAAARLEERLGTKAVVTAGMLLDALGVWLLSGTGVDTGYGTVALAIAVIGIGQGLAMAPATTSIMGSLPLAKTGVGSAMNDTTRYVGGALGVAVIGSVLSSEYTSSIGPALAGLPGSVASAARDGVGTAIVVAGKLGPKGAALAAAARSGFVDGMGTALLVALGFVVAGALFVLLFLPSRAASPVDPDEADRPQADPAGVPAVGAKEK